MVDGARATRTPAGLSSIKGKRTCSSAFAQAGHADFLQNAVDRCHRPSLAVPDSRCQPRSLDRVTELAARSRKCSDRRCPEHCPRHLTKSGQLCTPGELCAVEPNSVPRAATPGLPIILASTVAFRHRPTRAILPVTAQTLPKSNPTWCAEAAAMGKDEGARYSSRRGSGPPGLDRMEWTPHRASHHNEEQRCQT